MSNYIDDLLAHKNLVATMLLNVCSELRVRAAQHDQSKFLPEERDIYEQVTPKFKFAEYGSEDYKAIVKELGPALQHHYACNSHHPEHYGTGVTGMDLFDVIEMLCDWAAVSSDINKSLEINRERFGIDEQLYQILKNTIGKIETK